MLCGVLWLVISYRISKKQFFIVVSLSFIILGLLIVWNPESVFGRFFVGFISLKMMIAKPLGWGIFAFEKYYPEFQASYLELNHNLLEFISPEVVHSPFNEFLNIGVSLGILGLLLFLALVVFVFYTAVKLKSSLVYTLFIFIIISLFYFPFKIAPLIALIVPLVAFISNNGRILYKKHLSQGSTKIIIVILSLFSLFLTLNSISNCKNYKRWVKSVSLSRNNESLIESERLFFELYPVMKENGRFLITYSNLKYQQGKTLKALYLLEEAENYFCDITLSIKLGKLYEAIGDYPNAEEFYSLAENIAPNNFTASYEKIVFYINIGRFDEAYHLSKTLLNKPIKKTSYADPFIIKSRLRTIINEYEEKKSISTFGNTQYSKKR